MDESTSVVTITHTDGDVFVDATSEHGDLSILEALGMIELAKTLLIEQAS